jgi:RNA polymerase sigma factor (sigma-70 family)
MATADMSSFLRRLMRGMAAEAVREQPDRQLVERLVAGPDEAAFEAIMRRHGPMVYRVCRRVLRHEQDTEDAFQATFLVLARRLGTVRRHASLASWLHGVARRVALKAGAQAATRRRHERKAATDTFPPEEVPWRELRDILDAELERLPEKWRAPLVLCYLEGQTQDEAAGQQGWSPRTLRRRLEEAKAALGRRLTRRGLRPAALSAVLPCDCPDAAALAPRLIHATAEAAACLATGQAARIPGLSARAAALTEGVLQTMFVSKIKTATAALVLLTAFAVGAGGLLFRAQAVEPHQAPKAGQLPPQQGDQPKARPPEGDEPKAGPKEPLDKALQLVKDSDADPYDKVRLLAEIGGAQARRGDKKEAARTLQLALGLVKDIEKDRYKVGALSYVARNQFLAGDLDAVRKTLAAVVELRDKTDDDTVRLNATLVVDGVLTSLAAEQARRGEIPEALKTAGEIGNGNRRVIAYGAIAREQANRKDFAGALKTVERTESIRIPQMLFEVARIQEKTDKAGAEATWKLCVKELEKLQPTSEDDLVPERGGLNYRELLPALVERGHGAAVRQWIDGLPSVTLKVRLLLILAGAD